MQKKMGFWEAVSIAVGTMIGAGIFSILGVGAQICGENLPLAFGIAALFSLSIAYSYAELGSRYVSNAGPIEFILRGIGNNPVTGTLSILMWFSYVVSISLFAKAFAGYLLALLGVSLKSYLFTAVEVSVVVFFTVLNFFGSKAVGKSEFWIVLGKLLVLLSFVLLGVWNVNPELLKPSFSGKEIINTFYASSVLFLTYMGFGLVTNASENIENPKKNVPRAIYTSIAIVSIVYISVAGVAVGNLGAEGLVKAKEYALAEASRPFLGDLGFKLVSIGALLSTSSAINATLYGGANIAYVLAKRGHLPPIFERKVWFDEPEGLYATAVLSVLLALFLDLGGISSLISFVFLMIYIFVIASHYRLAREVGSSRAIIAFNFAVVLCIVIVLSVYQWKEQRESFYTELVIVAFASFFELAYRKITGRFFKLKELQS